MRAPGVILVALGLCACAGQQNVPDHRETGRSERVVACETLVGELATMDTDLATEAQLVAAMESADAMHATCTEAFAAEADTQAERIMAQHRADQLTLHALFLEATLSGRFDDDAHYCAIIRDTYDLLVRDLTTIEVALQGPGIAPDEQAQLVELRELDAEALDVLIVANERLCP